MVLFLLYRLIVSQLNNCESTSYDLYIWLDHYRMMLNLETRLKDLDTLIKIR